MDSLSKRNPLTGCSINGQSRLPQITANIETTVTPKQVIADAIANLNTTSGPVIKYEGPASLGIKENDLIFVKRPLKEIEALFPLFDSNLIKSNLQECSSAFASFCGKRQYNDQQIYRQIYKFMGLARSAIDFNDTIDLKQLTVACGGVLNWTNYTNETVEPGAVMTWAVYNPDIVPKPTPAKKRNFSIEVTNPNSKAIFVPLKHETDYASNLVLGGASDAEIVAAVKAALNIPTATTDTALIRHAIRMGQQLAVGRHTHIVGVNGGYPVAPFKTGDIILNMGA